MKILPPSTWALHKMIYAQAPLVLWPRDGWLALVTEMAWLALHIYQSLCPLGSWTLSKRTECEKHICILKTNKPKHKKVNFQFSFIFCISGVKLFGKHGNGNWLRFPVADMIFVTIIMKSIFSMYACVWCVFVFWCILVFLLSVHSLFNHLAN